MKRKEAEDALEKVVAARTELNHMTQVGAIHTTKEGARGLSNVLLNLVHAADILRAEVEAKAKNAKNYRMTVRHEGKEASRTAYRSADTAISWARRAHAAGAVVAEVRRASDDVVVYDGPAGVELDYKEW